MSAGGSGVIIIFVVERVKGGTERREGRAALGRSQVMDPNRIVSNVSQEGASEKMRKEQRQTVNLVLH